MRLGHRADTGGQSPSPPQATLCLHSCSLRPHGALVGPAAGACQTRCLLWAFFFPAERISRGGLWGRVPCWGHVQTRTPNLVPFRLTPIRPTSLTRCPSPSLEGPWKEDSRLFMAVGSCNIIYSYSNSVSWGTCPFCEGAFGGNTSLCTHTGSVNGGSQI